MYYISGMIKTAMPLAFTQANIQAGRPHPDTGGTNLVESSFVTDRPNPDTGKNNPGLNDEILPLLASILGESSIANPSNVQPTASSSATPPFSPEIVRPFPKALHRKTRDSRTKKLTIYTDMPEREAVRQEYEEKGLSR